MIIDARDEDILKKDDLQRIEENPAILIGKPILRGTRISVTQVLLNMAVTGSIAVTTHSLQDIVPSLTEEDILAALRFAAVVCDRQLLDKPGRRAEDLGAGDAEIPST